MVRYIIFVTTFSLLSAYAYAACGGGGPGAPAFVPPPPSQTPAQTQAFVPPPPAQTPAFVPPPPPAQAQFNSQARMPASQSMQNFNFQLVAKPVQQILPSESNLPVESNYCSSHQCHSLNSGDECSGEWRVVNTGVAVVCGSIN